MSSRSVAAQPGVQPAVEPPFTVLFVCIGNVCRSPLGERLLAARLDAERFVVASAGVNGLEGEAMDPDAAAELVRLGGDPDGFVARRVSQDVLAGADLVLTATKEVRSRLLAEAPAALRRTFTVREFAALLDEVAGVGQVSARRPVESPGVAGRVARSGRSSRQDRAALTDLVARAAAARSRARLDDYDIPDPYRRSAQTHAEAARLMATAVERIAKGLQP